MAMAHDTYTADELAIWGCLEARGPLPGYALARYFPDIDLDQLRRLLDRLERRGHIELKVRGWAAIPPTCRVCGHPVDMRAERTFIQFNPDIGPTLSYGRLSGGGEVEHSHTWQCVLARVTANA